MKIRPLLILALVGLCSARLVAVDSSHSLHSPNGAIVADVRVSDRICFDLTVADMMILKDSTLSLRIDDETLGLSPQLRSAETRSHDDVLHPVVRQKAAELRDHYNELRLEMEGGYAVVFRAYDEGVAYRWETSLPAEEVKVFSEEVTVN
uniref:glycoside hydrolase family 97 N-terminal domain-containing protein n=1 Tax=Cephaloticoccus sp. TaxID=1985742 RepID=UPI00404BA005